MESKYTNVRDILRSHGFDNVLIVRHDKDNIRKMKAENRSEGNIDTILRATSEGIEFIAIFEASNYENAVLQRMWKFNGVPPEKLGDKNYEWLESIEAVDIPDLENKIVIDKWAHPRSYCLKDENIPNLAYICHGYKGGGDFPDRPLDVKVTYDELSLIFGKHNHLYPDWTKGLSEIDGIYLLKDSATGKSYVGATYNENGIWGRWGVYISNKILVNEHLTKYIESVGTTNMYFTILEHWKVGSKNQEETQMIETMWKNKLETSVNALSGLGLNGN